MNIHREGRTMLAGLGVILVILNMAVFVCCTGWLWFVALLSMVVFALVLQFFRNPDRPIPLKSDELIYAPADGKIVVIEETDEPEYFKDRRIQVSIFMSPFNVHVNRNPIRGVVKFFRYHAGKYLVAWHPKASTENERTTLVLGNAKGEILLRQIAGALAKRILNYLGEGQQVEQGSEMGFIKFGSRVDLFLPLDAKVEVEIGQTVQGNITVIATW